jgi:hypothetical protein
MMVDTTLAEKLVAASKAIGKVAKDGNNTFQHYTFQSEAAIKSAVKSAIESVGVQIIPNYEVINQYDRTSNKGGINHYVDVLGTFDITDGKEHLTGTMPGSGQDSGEKAMMKATTVAQKYFYKQLFNISDQDPDPDSETATPASKATNNQSSPQQSVPKPPSKSQLTRIDNLAKKLGKIGGKGADEMLQWALAREQVSGLNELTSQTAARVANYLNAAVNKATSKKRE